MGNWIVLKYGMNCNADFKLSNGGLDWSIDCLVVSGSELATTDSEKRMIVFLSERNTSTLGLGVAGFELPAMPWKAETFEADRAFLIRTAEHAKEVMQKPETQQMLQYSVEPERVNEQMDEFIALFRCMTADLIVPEAESNWFKWHKPDDPTVNSFPKCRRHGVLYGCDGCKICLDQSGLFPVMPADIERLKHLWEGTPES